VSSAPSGIDSKEYAYSVLVVDSDASTHHVDGWMVTRIQYFARSAAGSVRILGNVIDVVADACIELEPNGAHRAPVTLTGTDFYCVIEYWFPAQAAAVASP